MKALVLTGFQKELEVLEMPDPALGSSRDVIVRVEANGICRSDWHLWMGDWDWIGLKLELPHIMGHEFAGVVESVGADVSRYKVGDRVLVPHAHGDGVCEYCLNGQQNVCEHVTFAGTSYWGGYGRYVNVPDADRNLIRLPENVSFDAAAGLGCRFMTAFHGVVDQVAVRPGEWVSVHGCGGVGLSAIHIAAASGAHVIAVDINDEALSLAQSLGAVATINAKTGDVAAQIREITGGGVHVSVDALGIAATCQAAVNSLRKRGRMLQVGMTSNAEAGMIPLPIDNIVLQELRIIGSANMPIGRYPDMMRMLEQGVLDPGKLITNRVGIEQAGDILTSMGEYRGAGVSVLNRW
ncbi:zinc-dependent alcohol dehydrogenase family protein [Glutamicibacter halophytocola]|uniref:zinc-dependent alcohol dehydrogenase family protein n=1 Tax=Glutamicibacter halophytocola TaxID=1933880 RepID=UPI00155A0292|nr:zinc-dependent alcohol dehydrogenase family protein [Glutamicibacter halophytocola]NQD42250.1 zinc-dependent alcohol dehydrogenase family protein [Glutamicibacter halophytocola]